MLGIQDLSFRYRKSTEELFDGLTHQFASGQVTALTGRSGRGKSTLLYILGLLLLPSQGQVIIDGNASETLDDGSKSRIRAAQIGFVFQDSALDPSRTILSSVIEPALYDRRSAASVTARAMELLDSLGVGHRANHKPHQISGGQAQRVAVCRALICNPGIILADEPTGNLDQESAEIVLDALKRASREGRTVVIATHDPFVMGKADQVLEL